jgi:hypothetical protein
MMPSLVPGLLLLTLIIASVATAAELKPEDSARVVRQVKEWLRLPREKRPAIPQEVAVTPLTKADAAELHKLLWDDHVAELKTTRAEEMKSEVLPAGEWKMKFKVVTFGDKKQGQPLFISMHGGGGAPARVNERQWLNQVKLAQDYKPAAGFYVAPRGPTNDWNLWHKDHIDALFDRLIQNMIALEGVDPNRVYLMGYSAGGDGVYQLAPRMADRLAAASMMAGHPNEASPLGLRNIGFTIHVGANDDAYGRNKVAGEWGRKLDELEAADPKGYAHMVKLHEGCGHWMKLNDRAAIPWMEKFTRNPIPEKIVWHQDDVIHDRFYWLAVPREEANAGQDIVAVRSGQTITISAAGNPHVTILLNDAMLDLDQPVTVTFNGNTLPPRHALRTLAVIRRTLEERGDPHLVFSGEITLP